MWITDYRERTYAVSTKYCCHEFGQPLEHYDVANLAGCTRQIKDMQNLHLNKVFTHKILFG